MAPAAELVLISGNVLTMAREQPRATALAVSGGRIAAVGSDEEVQRWCGPDTEVVRLDGRTVLPGFVEAHGHPTLEMVLAGPDVLDIRPVTCATAEEVLARLRAAVATAEPGAWLGAYGWDPLLQDGLPAIDRRFLDELCPDHPLSVMHNSGHSAWGNTLAIQRAGITRDTPDPLGSRFERDEAGEPTGAAFEAPATAMVLGGAISRPDADNFGALMSHEHDRLARAGITTVADLGFRRDAREAVQAFARSGAAKVRMRVYEVSVPEKRTDVVPGEDRDDLMFQQVGIKIWADGSPWVGNIGTSFPYLDTPQTRSIGLAPGHRGGTNYSRQQLTEIVAAYFPPGWQIACHVHGDEAVDMVLDVFAEALAAHPERTDARLRLEHCGAMTPEQYQRAAELGVTCSLFVDHLYYWGDVLVDGLFGARAESWTCAGAALQAGVPISFHNDSPVTPPEPLRNVQVAVTRTSRSGRVIGPQFRTTVEQALRAETIDAAWQLFAEHDVGSLEVGKRADLVVLDADPNVVPPGEIGDIPIRATYLDGRCTFRE
ncbi:amidohydrolase [Saccharopolyspora sp. WRP15-2]|uniref:Amidohydrolase n=1 Tax=Saccharopolyspora oryzae TaxID=2997343 RepID=A0ABT4V387_9PSEU|nr:amidohydrolase [Saccharopolyspora oryzae]MDA3628430.1 amidohydrolase [Saccharopolyspora oryzae]